MAEQYKEYLREKYASVDRKKIVKKYKKDFEPEGLLKGFSSAMNTMKMKQWVDSDKCEWEADRKAEFVLSYVDALEKAKAIQKFLRSIPVTTKDFREWKIKQSPEQAEDLLNSLEKTLGSVVAKKKKSKQEENPETESLKIRVPKKEKKTDKTDKKEETKPKTDN